LFSFDLGRAYRCDSIRRTCRTGAAGTLSLRVERPRIKVKPSTTVARAADGTPS
jgi:hypothetical protein